MRTIRLAIISIALLCLAVASAQTPDITKEPTLYVVPYAHLDTQWNWDFVKTINEYLPSTTQTNFKYFDKYPHYVFNFSGANRYRLIQEYFPKDFERVKKEVAAGRWYPAGSSMEESDVNSPSAESIFRQILYGNEWFRQRFNKSSAEYMLPDCFGFPASLPSILAHAGVKGFSTQKLSKDWQPAPHVGGPGSPEQTPEGIPFNVGFWKGPDGRGVIAALNPESYTSRVTYDFSKSPAAIANARALTDWPARIDIDGKLTGLFADYHYIGTGDIGGAVDEESVKLLEAIVTKGTGVIPPPDQGRRRNQPPNPESAPPVQVQVGDGPVHVVPSFADQMFLDMIKTGKIDKLPTYSGDLELINHSAGSLTSQAYLKRWNRQNEVLADAAERASVAAYWLGVRPYPTARLNDAWTLVMGGQFHDTMAGTAIPKAYEYAHNDEVIALNQFAEVLTSATEGVVSAMDTRVRGVPLVVYNPLQIGREDIVEATMTGAQNVVHVTGPDGKEVPAQMHGNKLVFLAKVPANGYAIYDVQGGGSPAPSTLKVSENSLENARYKVTLDTNGDIASIFDKQIDKELLSAPARLALQYEKPEHWPAWNMDWEDQRKPPRGYVTGPAKFRIVENGPARVALEVSRETDGSKFVQTIRLAAGDAGNRVEIANAIDWKTGETALKASFPLSPSNPVATYNWDIGTVQRQNNEERKFEVPSHQWIDLTDNSGAYGATILTDAKNGSDKPDDHTLRLTLIYSPGVRNDYKYQSSNDWGHHEFIYGFAGHAGDWRKGQTDWQGYRLNQPLAAFQTVAHPGPLGKEFSLLKLSTDRVRILAVKLAEQGRDIIVRMTEVDGQRQENVRLTMAGSVLYASEMTGQEQRLSALPVDKGGLNLTFTPYQTRTIALQLAPPSTRTKLPTFEPALFNFDRAVGSNDGTKSNPGFTDKGEAIPAEMLPYSLDYGAIRFTLAPSGSGIPNAMVPNGQEIPLAKPTRRIYILAAADGDQKTTFELDGKPRDITINNWGGNIGLWDTRQWKSTTTQSSQGRTRVEPFGEMTGIVPGFVKQTPVAWYASHHHNAQGQNQAYEYSYLFAYTLSVPPGTKKLKLPVNDKVRILAITVSDEDQDVTAASRLYDTLEKQ